MLCWIEGGAGFFFLAFCLAAPSSYRVDRGRHLASSTFAGGLNVELSLPIFRLALAVFIPWRGADGFRPARGMAPALMLCWIEGGAGFFLFSCFAWRRRRATGSIAAGTWRRRHSPGAQCRALSPDFPAGARGLYPLARG